MRSRVTTKKGDAGSTRTLAGVMLPKNHVVLECTGELDALRAQLALLRLLILEGEAPDREARAEFLWWLLHVCFLIGTEVNDPENTHPEYRITPLSPNHLEHLEAEQMALEARLNLPKSFIASAANPVAAHADITATIARALERKLVHLAAAVPGFEAGPILAFVNRLSDFLYILARHLEEGQHQPVDYAVLE